ncbi:nucleotide disphospho-sugar-binding domain-containing protein [Mycobacterium sp. URHB0021]
MQPMLQIAAHLRRTGHEVWLLTGEAYREAVQAVGVDFAVLPSDGCVDQALAESLSLQLLPSLLRRYARGRREMQATFIAPLAAQYASLDNLIRRESVDAVLVDLAFTGALPLLCATRARPALIVCGVGPLTLSSAAAPPFGIGWAPRADTDYSGLNRVHRRMLHGVQADLNRALAGAGSPPSSEALVDWPRLADRMVQLTVPSFEYPRADLPAGVDFVGPVFHDNADTFEAPEWWNAIETAGVVVHVTQGTLDNTDLDQLIGPSLAALADDDDVVVVATTGRRDGHRPQIRLPANALVCDWLPYSALMPHVDVMITNGGYGGVHHALRCGVPLVVAGESADKSEVAARVAHFGLGVNLGSARPRVADIAAAVRRVRDVHSYRARARELGSEITRSDPLNAITEIVDGEIARRSGVRPTLR